MYIAGKETSADKTIDVINPYNNKVVARVPAATKNQVSEAFRIGANYQAKLEKIIY